MAAMYLLGQSQPPAPAPREAAQENQGKTAPKTNKSAPDDEPTKSTVVNSVTVVTGRDQQEPSNPSEGKTSTDWWALANTGLITIFTGVLAFLAYQQWQTLKGHEKAFLELAGYMRDGLEKTTIAANAARDSADVTAVQLELTERPWLSIETDATSDLTYDASGLNIASEARITNTGKTPAVGTMAVVRLYVSGSGNREAFMKSLCAELAQETEHSYAIFPQAMASITPKPNINRNVLQSSVEPGSGRISIGFITAVVYRSTFTSKIYYTVRFNQIVQFDGKTEWWTIQVDNPIPLKDVRVLRNHSPLIGDIDKQQGGET
jgi:hypothetical protein